MNKITIDGVIQDLEIFKNGDSANIVFMLTMKGTDGLSNEIMCCGHSFNTTVQKNLKNDMCISVVGSLEFDSDNKTPYILVNFQEISKNNSKK